MLNNYVKWSEYLITLHHNKSLFNHVEPKITQHLQKYTIPGKYNLTNITSRVIHDLQCGYNTVNDSYYLTFEVTDTINGIETTTILILLSMYASANMHKQLSYEIVDELYPLVHNTMRQYKIDSLLA